MAQVTNVKVKVLELATDVNENGYGCNFGNVSIKDAYINTGENKGKVWKSVTARVSIINPQLNKLFEELTQAVSEYKPKNRNAFDLDFEIQDEVLTQGKITQIANIFLDAGGNFQNSQGDIVLLPLESLVIGLAGKCLKKETPIAKTICKFIQTNKAGKIIAEGEWIVTFFNQLRELVSKKHSVTQETV